MIQMLGDHRIQELVSGSHGHHGQDVLANVVLECKLNPDTAKEEMDAFQEPVTAQDLLKALNLAVPPWVTSVVDTGPAGHHGQVAALHVVLVPE